MSVKKKRAQIGIRIDDKLSEELAAYAKERGVKESFIVREAIKDYLSPERELRLILRSEGFRIMLDEMIESRFKELFDKRFDERIRQLQVGIKKE